MATNDPPQKKPDGADIKALVSMVAKHEKTQYVLTFQQSDNSFIVHSMLPKCERCSSSPCTVKHRYMNVSACDRCCAHMIVKISRSSVDAAIAYPDDALHAARLSLMDENDWVDVENAERIRRIDEYVRNVGEYDLEVRTYH